MWTICTVIYVSVSADLVSVWIFNLPNAWYMGRLQCIYWFNHPNMWRTDQIVKLLITQFSPVVTVAKLQDEVSFWDRISYLQSRGYYTHCIQYNYFIFRETSEPGIIWPCCVNLLQVENWLTKRWPLCAVLGWLYPLHILVKNFLWDSSS